jgi:serine/threonine protein kinase
MYNRSHKNSSEGYPATALREISFLNEMNHPNIVRIKDIVADPFKLLIVFEYMDCDLKMKIDSLEKGTTLSRRQVKHFMYQLLSGMAEIHSRRIMHRDIKPQNLLLKGDLLKIGDLGLARALSEPTRPYTADVAFYYTGLDNLLQSARDSPQPKRVLY